MLTDCLMGKSLGYKISNYSLNMQISRVQYSILLLMYQYSCVDFSSLI